MATERSLLVCPVCRHALEPGESRYLCPACGEVYPAVLGIPDLRSFDPPYASRAQDLERARRIADRYDDLDFPGLLRFAYAALHPEIPAEDLDPFVDHRLQRSGLNDQRWQRSQVLARECGLDIQRGGVALDLGCGVGGLLPTLSQNMSHAVGVDIVMEELILTHKLLSERGVRNVTLLCADAETLPLNSKAFSLVNATNVIEHVRNPGAVLQSVCGLLAPGGVFTFDSPNRWDLLHPEPHVGIRFVGLWPRPLQEPYVRLVTGKEYKHKRLLSLPELRRLLRRHASTAHHSIFYWPRWRPDRRPRTALGRLLLRRWPTFPGLLNRVWALFVGSHEVVVWRPAERVSQHHRRVLSMPVTTDGHTASAQSLRETDFHGA